MAFLRIEKFQQKIILGHSLRMSLINNRTFELWSSFMPHRNEIENCVGQDLYSIQIYDNPMNIQSFKPSHEFTKFAGVEVNSEIPKIEKFESLIIPDGLYAVFLHKGRSSDFAKTAMFIYRDWIPKSDYTLDHRPHIEVLGENYKRDDINSEEEVWIPIKLK